MQREGFGIRLLAALIDVAILIVVMLLIGLLAGGSMIAVMSTPRARQDMETYLQELAKHDAPTDRDILEVWEKMLAAR